MVNPPSQISHEALSECDESSHRFHSIDVNAKREWQEQAVDSVAELKNDFATAFALRGVSHCHFRFAQRVSFFDLRF
jgi:hypothetical protein